MKALNIVVLTLNGLFTAAIGFVMVQNAPGQLMELGLTTEPVVRGTFFALGLTVLFSSGFSFLAAYWCFNHPHMGRLLSALIGGVLLVGAVALFVIADVRIVLLTDGIRGLVVLAVAMPYHPRHH